MKEKIDFFSLGDELFDSNIEWIVPLGVLEELGKISKRRGEKERDKKAGKLGIEVLKKNNVKKIDLGSENVDDTIVNYISLEKEVVLATLDRELKKKVGRILTVRAGKKLELV